MKILDSPEEQTFLRNLSRQNEDWSQLAIFIPIYSVVYIDTRGSGHDQKEGDDEESESVEQVDLRHVCQRGNIRHATCI